MPEETLGPKVLIIETPPQAYAGESATERPIPEALKWAEITQ
jgi:hypothetical protein